MRKTVTGLLAAAGLIAGPAHAAPGDWVNQIVPIPAPVEPAQIALDGQTDPGEAWFQTDLAQRRLWNVAHAQLIPVADTLHGSDARPAVIVIPGGGFQFLSMDNEGYLVARQLVATGLRVFILKYRTTPIAGGTAGLKAALAALFQRGEGQDAVRAQVPLAVADTQAALRLVRSQAGQWHVDPAHVGVLGFSAGAMTVLGLLQADAAEARPDFAAMIYGPTQADTVPAHRPPLFAAIAADDRFFGGQDFSLISNWRKAGGPIEFHLFSAGGHGFATQPTGTTSDLWLAEYVAWLRAQGLTAGR